MVEVPQNEIMQGSATTVTCVQGLQLQKVHSRPHGRSGPFPIPCDDSVVVVSSSNGEFRHTMMSCDRVIMCHSSHQFKVTICDGSLRVCESDKGVLCPLFVGLMPEVQLMVRSVWSQPGCGNEAASTHSQPRCVSGSHNSGRGGYYLMDLSGAIVQGPSHQTEIVQKVMLSRKSCTMFVRRTHFCWT